METLESQQINIAPIITVPMCNLPPVVDDESFDLGNYSNTDYLVVHNGRKVTVSKLIQFWKF